jgi:hypothetical protein
MAEKEGTMNPTYLPYDSATNKMSVLLEGQIVGHIRAHAWGWHYVPVGQTQGGDTFKDIAGVKRSLEMEPVESV